MLKCKDYYLVQQKLEKISSRYQNNIYIINHDSRRENNGNKNFARERTAFIFDFDDRVISARP